MPVNRKESTMKGDCHSSLKVLRYEIFSLTLRSDFIFAIVGAMLGRSGMKVIKVVMACLSIIFAAWTISADEELQNLIPNPDFANGQSGWTLHSGNVGAAATWEIRDKDGVGNERECAFIEITALAGASWYQPNLYTSQVVPLENNTEYTCSLWLRTEEGMERDITLTIQRGSDPWTRFTEESFSMDGEWKEYWMTWTQPETLANAWLMIHTPGSNARVDKGKLWIDHIRLYEGEFKEDELSLGEVVKAVKPVDKLTTAWGNVKYEKRLP